MMNQSNLRECEDCGKEISKDAEFCPNCGKSYKPILLDIDDILSACGCWFWLIILLVVLIILGLIIFL